MVIDTLKTFQNINFTQFLLLKSRKKIFYTSSEGIECNSLKNDLNLIILMQFMLVYDKILFEVVYQTDYYIS